MIWKCISVLAWLCFMAEKPVFGNEIGIERTVQAYLNRVQQLSNILPNHEIELQLELPSNPNVDVSNLLHNKLYKVPKKQLSSYYYPKYPYVKYRASTPDIRVFPDANTQLVTRASTVKIMEINPTTQFSPPPSNYEGNVFEKTNESILREGNENSSKPDDNKRPVYMEDLKKALDEFEKRVFSGNATKNDPEDDGKQPLLKKDLWMALGAKFLKEKHNDCGNSPHRLSGPKQQNHQQQNQQYRVVRPFSNDDSGQTLNRILQLLKQNPSRVKIHANAPTQNLEWLQVKIPK